MREVWKNAEKGEIQLAIWPNVFWHLDIYIFKLREIPLAIWTNTFDNLDKPVAQGSAQGLEKCGKGKKASWSWKGQDCFCEGEAPWQVGTAGLVNFYSQQIQSVIWTNTFLDLDKIHLTSWHCWPGQLCIPNKFTHNLDKYILKFGQIYFQIKRNTFDKLALALVNFVFPTNTSGNLDKYILKFGQIYFQTKRNTYDKLALLALVNFVFPTSSPTIWTNTFWNLNKIYFQIKRNKSDKFALALVNFVFPTNSNTSLEKYILKFVQIYFQIKRNTSDKLAQALVNFVFTTNSTPVWTNIFRFGQIYCQIEKNTSDKLALLA